SLLGSSTTSLTTLTASQIPTSWNRNPLAPRRICRLTHRIQGTSCQRPQGCFAGRSCSASQSRDWWGRNCRSSHCPTTSCQKGCLREGGCPAAARVLTFADIGALYLT